MDAEGRVKLIRDMRIAMYWRDLHTRRLDELVERSLDAGFNPARLARILHVHPDTIRRRYVYPRQTESEIDNLRKSPAGVENPTEVWDNQGNPT